MVLGTSHTVLVLGDAVPGWPRSVGQYPERERVTGVVETTHRIDRELICRGDDDCVIKFDVAVKPMRYFQIIKVRARTNRPD